LPGMYAHHAFGLRALKASGAQAEPMPGAQREAFLLGCQGPDFCYYHLIRPGAKADWVGLARTLHSREIGQMMQEGLTLAGNGNDRSVRAYFLGYLTHYALDAYAHPYVFYHCYKKKYHLRFEAAIDAKLMERDGFNPSRSPLYRLVGKVDAKQKEAIAAFWQVLLKKGYNINVAKSDIKKVLTAMRRAFRLTVSRFGIKKRVLELAAGHWGLKDDLRALFYTESQVTDGDCLNEGRRTWSLPWDKDQRRDLSYPMIEEQALRFAAGCLEAAIAYWGGTGTLAGALERIGRMSMLTGEDWRMEHETYLNVSRRFFASGSPGQDGEETNALWQQ